MRFASSAAHQQGKIARLTRERDAALEQQTATSEVLHVNSTSRGELEPVFQIMLERAVRICEAKFGALYRFDSDALRLAAQVGASRELAELRSRRGPFQPTQEAAESSSPAEQQQVLQSAHAIQDQAGHQVWAAA